MKAFSDYSKQMQYNKITSLLIAFHTWRIGGIAFLWGMTQGLLDPAFAIPAGVGDILIGVTAIPFAIFLWKGYSWSKYAILVWSVRGIADLVNAVTLGVITTTFQSLYDGDIPLDFGSYHGCTVSASLAWDHIV
jgi:hypothetical protein